MATKPQNPAEVIEEGCDDILYKVGQAHKRYSRYTKSKSMSMSDSIIQKELTPIIVKQIEDILKGVVVTKRRASDNYDIGVFHTQIFMPVDIAKVHLLVSTEARTTNAILDKIYQEHFTNLANYLQIHALDIYISGSQFIESIYSDPKRINRVHRDLIGMYDCAFVFKFNYTEQYDRTYHAILYPND